MVPIQSDQRFIRATLTNSVRNGAPRTSAPCQDVDSILHLCSLSRTVSRRNRGPKADGPRATAPCHLRKAAALGKQGNIERKQPRLDSKAPAPCIRPCRKSKVKTRSSSQATTTNVPCSTPHLIRRRHTALIQRPQTKTPADKIQKSTEYTSLIIHPKTKKKNKMSPTKLYTRTANPVATRHHGWTRYQARRRN